MIDYTLPILLLVACFVAIYYMIKSRKLERANRVLKDNLALAHATAKNLREQIERGRL